MYGTVARNLTTGMPPLPLPKAFSKAVAALAISKARGVVFEGTSKGKDTRTEPTDMVLGVALPPSARGGGGGEYWNYSGLQIGLLPEQEGKF